MVQDTAWYESGALCWGVCFGGGVHALLASHASSTAATRPIKRNRKALMGCLGLQQQVPLNCRDTFGTLSITGGVMVGALAPTSQEHYFRVQQWLLSCRQQQHGFGLFLAAAAGLPFKRHSGLMTAAC